MELDFTSRAWRAIWLLMLALLLAGCGGSKAAPWHDYSPPDLGLAASFPNPFDAADEPVTSTEEGATR